MKKFLSFLLTLALALSCVSGIAEAIPVEADVLPQIGDVVNGFEVKEIRDFPLIGADLVLFEHQRTGGKLLWIANEDTNRAFLMSFPTRPSDNTGLPHVFEHATIFGSDKYPSTTLFFSIAYQTYNTYVNAFTTDACTGYPLGSLSEKQLLNLADYYVDACFNPLIMRDEGIFRTQAWHYKLPNLDGELTYEGVVYSEMQGSITLSRAGLQNANKLTFPGSSLCYNYGGLPENIPDMTYEDVKNFHNENYHPSNSFTVLYGQIEDYAAFLALLDEYFVPYEKAEFTFEEPEYTPITESVTAEFGFPMAEGTDITNQTQIIYYIPCPGMKGDTAQETLIDHLCLMLKEKASVLQQSFKKAFPAGSVSAGREVAAPDDAIIFKASGMNRGDAEQFKALVDDALRDVAANGFPQDMVDSAMTSLNISTKLAPENGNPVETILYNFVYYYAVTGNPFRYAENVDSQSAIDRENRDGLLKETAARWLADKELYTLTTTYPAPGEKEKQDAALKEKLAEIKAGMTQEELQAIVDATNAPAKDEDNSELMAKIQAVTVDSLPEEIKTYAVNDFTDENGLRHIEVPAAVDGIGYISLFLDAAALPQEDIHWMHLYTRLLGQLDTDRHTKEELDVLIRRYLYNKTTGIDPGDQGDSIHPYMVAQWFALDDDLTAGYDLMEELLFHTRFDDTQKLMEQVQAQKTSVRAEINGSPFNIMIYRGMADNSPFYRYYSYINFLDYYAFLGELETMLNENPEEVTKRFEAIQSFFHNNAGAVAAFAGNEQSIEVNRPLADAFMAKLDHVEREPAEYDLPVGARREALIVDGNIQYNNVIATVDDLGLVGYDAGLSAITQLVSDQVLMPILRDQMGVYTPVNEMVEKNGSMYLLSYRDPNVKETFDVYASLPELIAALDVDQESLDGYIMSVYSSLAKPNGELAGAINALSDTLSGKALDRNLDYMRQLKALKPDSVKAAAEIYRKAWENGVRSTAGSAAAINANADLYDVILNPFNAKDTSQVQFTDAAEGSEYYEAVRFAFENGLMAPKADDAFGTDDPATAGDFFGAIYVMIGGGSNAADEAIAALAEYGLVPDGVEAGTELTAAANADIFGAVTAALGAPWTPKVEAGTEELPLTRGQMAQLLQVFMGTLQ
ncbi:MAG: insulinase family protein [Clostridia bacterium]|nr:insulinase family protein [Clostridia bacterium]